MGMGGIAPPKCFHIWKKVGQTVVMFHAARELEKVFSVTFLFFVTIVGQLVKMPPPKQKMSWHITE